MNKKNVTGGGVKTSNDIIAGNGRHLFYIVVCIIFEIKVVSSFLFPFFLIEVIYVIAHPFVLK